MGLGNSGGLGTFVNISEGKLVIKDKATGEKTQYNHLTGFLTKLDIRDDEYDSKKFKRLTLYITDRDGANFQLQMKMGSSYANAFAFTIENADLTKEMTLIPSKKQVEGKDNYTFFISQGGSALKRRYTKDNPGQLPGLKKVRFNGEDKWDGEAQQEYITHMLLNVLGPKLMPAPEPTHPLMQGPASETHNAQAPIKKQAQTSQRAEDITEPIDDLPF